MVRPAFRRPTALELRGLGPAPWGGPRRGPLSSPRWYALSALLHASLILGSWAAVFVLDGTPEGSRSAQSISVAALELRPEAPPEEPPEVLPEVVFEEPPVEPRLVEAAFEPTPEPVEPPPEALDWLPPRDPFAGVTAASWKRYPPPAPEVAPQQAGPLPEPPSEPATPARVGEVDEPLALESPTPAYPKKARRLGWEGVVRLRIEVDAAGRVLEVELVESSGHEVLDEAAIAGFRRWVFCARRAGDPERRRFVKSFRFDLD